MKKLFFLCAFIFMSMQTSAQLVMVQTGNIGSAGYYDAWGVDSSGDYIFIFKPEDTVPEVFSYQNITEAEFMQEVNLVLNSIISQGYKLMDMNDENAWGTLGGFERTFYLAVP